MRVKNLPFPTCLVVIQGTQLNFFQSTGLPEDTAAALPYIFSDNFRHSLRKAISNGCAEGSALILAGHSLGGMEAQIIATDDSLRSNGYWPLSVITFGSPKVDYEVSNVVNISGRSYLSADYRRFTTIGDPIPFSTKATTSYQPTNQIVVDDRSQVDQSAARHWYDTVSGHLESLANATGSHMWYPCVYALRNYDALGHSNSRGTRPTELELDQSSWRTYSIPALWH